MNPSDLNPDALARLETKLLADLEVVRKVRALLEEHQFSLGSSVATQTPPHIAVVPGTPPVVEHPPAPPPAYTPPEKITRSFDEWITSALQTMPPEGFVLGNLKRAMSKSDSWPDDYSVKMAVSRLVRTNQVSIVRKGVGRIGNTYRYGPPTVPDVESAVAVEPIPTADT